MKSWKNLCFNKVQLSKSLKRWKVEKNLCFDKVQLTDCGRSSSKELSGDGKEALRNHLISICCNYTFSMEESGCHCSSKSTPNLVRMSYLEFFCSHLCLIYFATLFCIWGLGWKGFVCNFHLMCISYIVFSRVNWLVENGKDRYLQTSEMSKTMSPVVTDQVLSSKMGGHQTLTSPHLWRKIVKRFPPGKSCHSFDSPHDLTTYRTQATSSQKIFFNMWSVFFHFWAASVFPHLTDWLVMVG